MILSIKGLGPTPSTTGSKRRQPVFLRRTLAAGYGAEQPVRLAVDPVSEVEGIGTAVVAADPELDRPKAARAHAAGADRKRPVKLPVDRVEGVDLADVERLPHPGRLFPRVRC